MTKICCFFLFVLIPNACLSGVTVVGTHFFIDSATRSLNIKVVNDNESDYLVKTTVDGDGIIILPPLFVLPKNRSNIITLIPDDKIKIYKDAVYSLTITTIPKAELNKDSSLVSLAVRSHFKLLYLHKRPSDDDVKKMKLIRSSTGEWFLTNPTLFAFTLSLTKDNSSVPDKIQVIPPHQQISVSKYCDIKSCSLWINVFNEDRSVVNKINLVFN